MREPADSLDLAAALDHEAPAANRLALEALERTLAAGRSAAPSRMLAADAQALADATTSAAEQLRRQIAVLEGLIAISGGVAAESRKS